MLFFSVGLPPTPIGNIVMTAIDPLTQAIDEVAEYPQDEGGGGRDRRDPAAGPAVRDTCHPLISVILCSRTDVHAHARTKLYMVYTLYKQTLVHAYISRAGTL